ncbi:MAG: hypothetical protein LBU78_13370 [Microbacterium sp.]|jgi:hypothetical protein|nr:hypothetical protein [Microbacterium sp.]
MRKTKMMALAASGVLAAMLVGGPMVASADGGSTGGTPAPVETNLPDPFTQTN